MEQACKSEFNSKMMMINKAGASSTDIIDDYNIAKDGAGNEL